jgi:hypothetical protein
MKKRYGATEISFFLVQVTCAAFAFHAAWYAGIAVIIGILSQSVWTTVLTNYEKRLENEPD